MGKLKNFLGNAKKELKLHWNTPDVANGKYVSWREHLDIFGSVAANYAAQAPLTYIGFGAWCFLIMYHYNLPYIAFTVISLIGIPLSYLWNILGWFVADNLGILPKKTEKKLFIFYFCAIAFGLLLVLTDFTKLIDQNSNFIVSLNSIEGISARSFFKIFGVQILTSAFGGARGLFWRKKLIPKYGRYKYVLYSDCVQKCILIILVG